jgi:hypothetical protein
MHIMRLHALIAFLFAALALSCPPPLNNMDFLGNDTHTSYEIMQATFAEQGLGWVGK